MCRTRSLDVAITLTVALWAACACSGSGGGAPPAQSGGALAAAAGRFQVGFTGQPLAPLVARVTDAAGAPLAGVALRFELRRGVGAGAAQEVLVEPARVETDAMGLAEVTVSAGARPGVAIVEAWDEARLLRPARFELFVHETPDATRRALTVLAFNDLHMRLLPQTLERTSSGGLARLATVLQEIRAAHAARGVPVVVVNTGDDFENTAFHDLPGAIPALYEMYDQMGVDVLQVGNHDYHFGIPFLDEQVAQAEPALRGARQGHPMWFTWGNVDPSTLREGFEDYAPLFETGFEDPAPTRRYNQTLVLPFDGLDVGVLGVTTDAAVYTQVAGDPMLYRLVGADSPFSEGLTFFDPDPRASSYVGDGIDRLVSEGADVILVASHAGLGFGDRVNIPPGKDELIARHGLGTSSGRAPDLILSAHSHVQLNHPILVDNAAGGVTPMIQAREAGAFVAAVTLQIDTDGGEVSLVDGRLIQVDDAVPEDPEVAARVADLRQGVVDEMGPIFDRTVGQVPVDLSHRERAQSGLGQILADAFLWKVRQAGHDCDSAMVVPSIYRSDLDAGPITESKAYDVVPLHVLDDAGVNDEPIVILEFAPGLHDYTFFNQAASTREGVTAVAYILETIHSLKEAMDGIYPGASAEMNLEVVQLADMSYQVDAAAPVFHRVDQGSLRIGGAPIDPGRAYRVAMVHSIGVNLAYIINFVIQGVDPTTGEAVAPILVHGDGPDALPYVDTGIAGWEAFRDHLLADAAFREGTAEVPAAAVVTGERFRTRQADLSVSPSDIRWQPEAPRRGEALALSVTVRNLGAAAVLSAAVALYYDATPWDLTDDDDGHGPDERMPAGFIGSLTPFARAPVQVGAWPDTAEVEVSWDVPSDLVPWSYPIVVRLTDVQTESGEPEAETGNNAGPDQRRWIPIGGD
jgi:2',3'-cyclic-nucleotide 2'-phosphodiesterase (5'-nucleotidase family)